VHSQRVGEPLLPWSARHPTLECRLEMPVAAPVGHGLRADPLRLGGSPPRPPSRSGSPTPSRLPWTSSWQGLGQATARNAGKTSCWGKDLVESLPKPGTDTLGPEDRAAA
jgi:hypothetical protein